MPTYGCGVKRQDREGLLDWGDGIFQGWRGTALPYLVRMNTIIETPFFTRKSAQVWQPFERDAFINFIAKNPMAGVVIPGSGGIRKVRWSKEGTGKRSGVRVVYYNKTAFETWLLAVYAKNEVENLSINALKMMKEDIHGQ